MPTFWPGALAFFRVNSKETNVVLSLKGLHKEVKLCQMLLAVARSGLATVCKASFSLQGS